MDHVRASSVRRSVATSTMAKVVLEQICHTVNTLTNDQKSCHEYAWQISQGITWDSEENFVHLALAVSAKSSRLVRGNQLQRTRTVNNRLTT